MKPAVTRLYAVLVVLSLVGLAAWAGTDWYQHRQKAHQLAQTTLREAAGKVTDQTVRGLPLDRTTLSAVFGSGGTTDPRWKVLLLVSPDRGTEFYRGPRPAADAATTVPRWEARTFSEVAGSVRVFRASGDPLTLSGIYEFYGRREIFSLLQACGITLFVLLVLTSAVVVVGARRTEDRDEGPASASAEPSPPVAGGPEDGLGASVDLPDLDLPSETREDEYWFDEDLAMEDLPPLQTPEEPEPTGPSLVNPASGLGWETFLTPRLEAELDRAAADNQDLALLLLACKAGLPDLGDWGAAVRESFPQADLLFDAEGGAAVVLPGRTLEQALKAARAFVGSADQRWPGAQVHAGAAARAGRLVPADTLLAEARSARRRTLAGTVRVLGLKTDPDRWREHLSSA